jgi:predicted ATPase
MPSVDLSSVTDHFSNYELEDNSGGAASSSSSCYTPKLYGRSQETQILLNTYKRMMETKQAQTVVVHGESGSGKTALVDTLREPVVSTNGYFVAGKYFEENEAARLQEPYSAIMAAFSDLCDLIIQSDDFGDDERKAMATALGSDVQILIKSISNLSTLVGDAAVQEIEMEASVRKFKVACKNFLHSIASEKHPVVIFLDDIQWADDESAQLVQALLEERQITKFQNVMFILAYREEKKQQVLEGAGALATGINMLRADQTDICLSNLSKNAVHLVVTSILGAKTPEIRKLSDIVEKRSSGNPLHVVTFLDVVQQEGLLTYDSPNDAWVFDVDEIQREIMVSETLLDLLTRKIERLADDTRETLKIASLLGYSFEESILLKIACTAIEDKAKPPVGCYNSVSMGLTYSDVTSQHDSVLSSVSEALKEGYIEDSRDCYHFSHDKLQSTFRSMISREEEDRLNLLIGEEFLASRESEHCNIYKAAVHLHSAPKYLKVPEQRKQMVRINMEAADYCKGISAFARAAAMLQTGLDILGPEERWSEEHFKLTLEMMGSLAKMQLVAGDFIGCKETTKQALCRSKTPAMNIPFYLIDVEVRMAGNEVNDAVGMATRALNYLGVKMPRKIGVRHVAMKLAKIKYMLRHKTDEDVLNLGLTDDPVAENSVKLLMHMACCCLIKVNSDGAVFASLLATELTLKNGLSRFSSCAFAIYGVAEASLGNIDRAYRFGRLALATLKKVRSKEAECHTVGFSLTMLAFHRKSFDELATPLGAVSNSGFQSGDILYGTYCAAHYYYMQIHMGANLQSVEGSMRRTYNRVSELGHDALLMWLEPSLQYVLNMQANVENWENISTMSGEIMKEEDFINDALEKNSPGAHRADLALEGESGCRLWSIRFGNLHLGKLQVLRHRRHHIFIHRPSLLLLSCPD